MNTKKGYVVYVLGATWCLLIALFICLAYFIGHSGSVQDILTSLDLQVADISRVSPFVASVLLFFTYLASPLVLIVVEIALGFYLIYIHRMMLAGFFIGSLVAGELLSFVVKNIFVRARPLAQIYDLPRTGYSFPSGHALLSVIFYGFTCYILLKVFKKPWQKTILVLATVLLIFIISISRIILEFHYATDIIGGWLLGGAVLLIIIMAYIHAHAHIRWERFVRPHGTRLILMLLLAAFIGFIIFGFFVTHPLKIRSTIMEYQLKA
jgi:membrane-associated phospholipid phosphatase